MKRAAWRSTRVLQAAWLSACLGLLGLALSIDSVEERGMILGWGLIVLTFPVGLAVFLALGWLTLVIGSQSDVSAAFELNSLAWVLVYWIPVTLSGFLQWFVAIPCLWRRFLRRRVSIVPRNPASQEPQDKAV